MSYLVAALKQTDDWLKQEPELPSQQYALLFLADELQSHMMTSTKIAEVMDELRKCWTLGTDPLLVFLTHERKPCSTRVAAPSSRPSAFTQANTQGTVNCEDNAGAHNLNMIYQLDDNEIATLMEQGDSKSAYAVLVHPLLLHLFTHNSGKWILKSRHWTSAWCILARTIDNVVPYYRARGIYGVKKPLFAFMPKDIYDAVP
jgi:hypothetical protein